MRRTLFIVNELTLLPLVWAVLSGRTVRVLVCDPLFSPLGPLLDRVVRLLGVGRAIDLFPEERDTWDFPNRIFSEDPLAFSEAWQRRAYRFDAADRDTRYGYALKLVVTNFLRQRYVATWIMVKLARLWPDLECQGISPSFAGLAESWLGQTVAVQRWRPTRLVNIVLSAIGLAAAVLFVLSRLRPAAPSHPVFLLADHDGLEADIPFFKALEDGGEIAIALRSPSTAARCDSRVRAYRWYLPKDGRFSPGGAWPMIVEAARDAFDLHRRYGWLEPSLFHQLALLPWRRAAIRGLLNRVRPRFFWSRDDYNVEHIIRRQELHRVGALQYGLNHAIQGICILLPQTRYVSMDVYYTMGAAFHPYFKDSWAPDMRLRAVGAFKMTREYFARPRRQTRGILFMSRFVVGNPEFVRAVRMAALAFPDRPIWVQSKKNYPSEAVRRHFMAECRRDLPNVSERDGPVYDLILEPELVVSDPSTIVGELIELKIPTLVIDVMDQKSCIFWNWPNLCVRSAEDCTKRLKALACGEERFDPSEYATLIDLEERPLSDTVRRDMGLAP